MHRDSMSKALREMGFAGIAVPHGFRTFASSSLHEMRFSPDVIEMQLSHKDGSVRGIYNRDAKYLDERREMMQRWADYLDSITV